MLLDGALSISGGCSLCVASFFMLTQAALFGGFGGVRINRGFLFHKSLLNFYNLLGEVKSVVVSEVL